MQTYIVYACFSLYNNLFYLYNIYRKSNIIFYYIHDIHIKMKIILEILFPFLLFIFYIQYSLKYVYIILE